MIKRVISLLLVLSIICVPVMANVTFSDLDSTHWGYMVVTKLVNDGTVKGYEDGSFKPSNLVTRAEFVKMMGIGPEVTSKEYSDVPNTHWGYDYIMTSGFETDDVNFYPSKPITRGEAIELLWKRQGSKKDMTAPFAIYSQYPKNPDAVKWAYNYKIMMGDDGVNLRLSDNISRVEAAALIVRTRETDYSLSNISYIDNVSDNLLKEIFDSFVLFNLETEYSANQKITNGELSKAALRIASYENNITYSKFETDLSFIHAYSKDVSFMASKVLGDKYATEEFADKNAVMEDMVAMLTYAVLHLNLVDVDNLSKDNYYSDVEKDISENKNKYLTYAFLNGIQVNSNGTLDAKKEVTYKDLAFVLLQFDSLLGTQKVYSTLKNADGSNVVYTAKLNKNISSYPSNKSDFACIIEGIDNKIYEKPFEYKSTVNYVFSFARDYSSNFIKVLTGLADTIKKQYNVDSELLIYPNLIWNTNSGFKIRLKCKIINVPNDNIDIKEMFGDMLVTDVDGNLKEGMEIFIETKIPVKALL